MTPVNKKNYTTTIILTKIVAILAGYLEYYYIWVNSLPAREIQTPAVGFLLSYQIIAVIPIIALISFQPLINEVINHRNQFKARTTLPIGVASLLLGIMTQDATWFAFRAIAPSVGDPLAYNWIRPNDYTAQALGYAPIFGLIIPIWYFIFAPAIIAIIAALFIVPETK